jgi:hypothetical protein
MDNLSKKKIDSLVKQIDYLRIRKNEYKNTLIDTIQQLCKEKLPTIEQEIFLNLYTNKLKKIIDEIQEKKILLNKEQSLQNNE